MKGDATIKRFLKNDVEGKNTDALGVPMPTQECFGLWGTGFWYATFGFSLIFTLGGTVIAAICFISGTTPLENKPLFNLILLLLIVGLLGSVNHILVQLLAIFRFTFRYLVSGPLITLEIKSGGFSQAI